MVSIYFRVACLQEFFVSNMVEKIVEKVSLYRSRGDLHRAHDVCQAEPWRPSLQTNQTHCSLRQGARPLKAHIQANSLHISWEFSGPHGPIWARMGPARALEERENFRKNAPVLFFFFKLNMLLNFLAEELYRTIMKSPQKQSFGTNTCSYGEK